MCRKIVFNDLFFNEKFDRYGTRPMLFRGVAIISLFRGISGCPVVRDWLEPQVFVINAYGVGAS